jgi:hypothetical protein
LFYMHNSSRSWFYYRNNIMYVDQSGRAFWGMYVSSRLFYVLAVLCVGSGLATGWSAVQRVLPTVYRITKLSKSGHGPNNGL